MLKFVRITFSLIALALVIYSFITDNRDILMPYMFIALGLMSFTAGIEELREQKKVSGTLCFLVGAAVLFIAISELLR
ncbi:YczI family protein [Bacillus cereus]|uniref:YczI family protein n=1 Tax=Bacillus cereus TaxID=1396 RepID=UPI0035702A83